MIIALYSLLLFVVFAKSRDIKDTSIRKIAVWAYNYTIAFVIYLILSFLKEPAIDTTQAILNILNSFYMAAKGVAFDKSFQIYRDVFYLLGDERIVEIQLWSIFLIASLSTTLTVVTILFEKKIRDYKLLFRFKRQKEKIIVVGNSKNATSLIQNILKTKKYENTIITYYTNDKIKIDNYKNVRVINIDEVLKENPYVKCNVNHEYHIVLMLKNKNENIEWLGKLTNLELEEVSSENNKLKHKNIHITVLCNNEQLRFNKWNYTNLDIYLISEEQLVIDKLMEKNPPISSLKNEFIVKDKFNYVINGYSACIIGFGDLGEEILLSVYENSRFINEDLSEAPFKALVIDKNMKKLKESFLSDVPYFKTNECIDFIDTEIGTKDFYDVIKNRLCHLHQIFIATGDNEANIQTALKLSNLIKRLTGIPKIVLFIRGESYLLKPLVSGNDMIEIINVCESIYTCDNLISRVGDDIAKEIHADYKKNHPNGEEWNEIDNIKKDSNRAVVRDIRNKKGLLNYWDDKSENLSSLRKMNIEEELCEKLAVYEHYRWNGFYFARGWTKLNKEDLTCEEKKDTVKRKNEFLKKHLCLVSWEELPDLPCQINKFDFQKNDYDSVTNLFNEKENREINYGA